jgi:transketolase
VGDEGEVISIETFGASAPYQKLLEEYGFTVANVIAKAEKLLKKKR